MRTFRGVEADIKRLAIRARDGQITVDDMTGGTLQSLMVYLVLCCLHQLSILHNQESLECTTLSSVLL
jgi:pyruvate/2-oxoglutarate dehydrogenase complex dihydrolipoamide acyltransferase (E2) component